jgi:hypothetical protein
MINVGVQVLLLHVDLHFFRNIPKSSQAGSLGMAIFSFFIFFFFDELP